MADLFAPDVPGKGAGRSRSRDRGTGGEDSRGGNAPPARSGRAAGRAEPSNVVRTADLKPRRRGRPREYADTTVTTVRLPTELLERVDELVAESGNVYRDRSEFIRQTIAQAVPVSSEDPSPARHSPRKPRHPSHVDAPVVGYVREPDGRLVQVVEFKGGARFSLTLKQPADGTE